MTNSWPWTKVPQNWLRVLATGDPVVKSKMFTERMKKQPGFANFSEHSHYVGELLLMTCGYWIQSGRHCVTVGNSACAMLEDLASEREDEGLVGHRALDLVNDSDWSHRMVAFKLDFDPVGLSVVVMISGGESGVAGSVWSNDGSAMPKDLWGMIGMFRLDSTGAMSSRLEPPPSAQGDQSPPSK